jgi:hypothetical protein
MRPNEGSKARLLASVDFTSARKRARLTHKGNALIRRHVTYVLASWVTPLGHAVRKRSHSRKLAARKKRGRRFLVRGRGMLLDFSTKQLLNLFPLICGADKLSVRADQVISGYRTDRKLPH